MSKENTTIPSITSTSGKSLQEQSFPPMELLSVSVPISALLLLFPILLACSIFLFSGANLVTRRACQSLPPGRSGWPFLGETLEFLRYNKRGCPERFVADRVQEYKSSVFRTSLLGEQIAFLCGPAWNKFVFSNEGKMVEMWWPTSVKRLVGPSLVNKVSEEAMVHKKLLMAGFFGTESLINCVPTMDEITRSHLEAHWEGMHYILCRD